MHDWPAYVRDRLPPLGLRPEREAGIVAELALQLEQAYTDAIALGAGDVEATRRAATQFADWSALAREIREAECRQFASRRTGDHCWNGFAHDVRYALRWLARAPVFAAAMIGTLALGIGGNTAIFSMVDAVALRPLPYRDTARLATIDTVQPKQPEIAPFTSAPDFLDFRARSRAFETVASISPVWSMVMIGHGDTERLEALFVSAGFFPMLGVQPALGRVFTPEEDVPGKDARVVLISHDLWVRRFGGSRDVRGQTVNLDGGAYTVIGVLPEHFRYAGAPMAGTASRIDVWLPMSSNPLAGSLRQVRYLKVIGRLARGVSLQRASDEAKSIGAALARQFPDTDTGFVIGVNSLASQVTGRYRQSMMLLLGAIAFVLLMACANVAGLLLGRASERQREIAVRVALGASRSRLLRQFLVEGAILAALGGALGLVLAALGIRALTALAPRSLLFPGDVSLDLRALSFTVAAAAASALLAGLPPAWRMVRADLESALREFGRGLTSGTHRLRSVLVVVQIAVALLLLVGSGLLIRSFQRVLDVNPGFDPRNLVTISTQFPASAQTRAQRTSLYQAIHEKLMAIPGVRSVDAVSRLPLGGMSLGRWIFIEGEPMTPENHHDVEYRVATPGYFRTMGMTLRAGRWLDQHDGGASILVNEAAAHLFWPRLDPVGRRVKYGPDSPDWVTVVGVVGNLRHDALDIDPRAEIYTPYAASPLGGPVLVIRTASDAGPLLPLLASAVRSVSSDMPAYNAYEMSTLVDRSTAQRRFVMWLLTGFGAVALLLAAVGIYAMISQAVVQRTRELGLRMALGASPRSAMALVFRQGMRLLGAGMAAGSLAALLLTRLMRNLLFDVRPLDPESFAAAVGMLMLFAVLACYLPARRATRVDPMRALQR